VKSVRKQTGEPARRPRRILMAADAVGGIWTFSLELARALAAEDVRLILAVLGPAPSPEARRDALAVPGLELHEGSYRLEWMEDPWEDLRRAGEWLLDVEADARPDLVHLNGFSLAAREWHAPVVVTGHSCVLSWWRAARGGDAPPAWDRYRKTVEAGLRLADGVAAPSRAMLRSLQTHYGLPRLRKVIRNGVDPGGFSPEPKEDLVLGVGRLWDEAKNLSALDRAAASLSWPTVVAGDLSGPEGIPLLPRHARALGRLAPAELRSWYGRAAIFAHPARYEPFGLAPLEAALSGCALVLGDIPSLREIWGDAALYAPPDGDALAHAVRTLANDRSLLEQMARRALARARRYTAHAMAAGYFDFYARVLRPTGATRKRQRCVS
jgi:glycogen synthase